MTNTLNDKFARYTENGAQRVKEGLMTPEGRDRSYVDIVKYFTKDFLKNSYLNLEKESKNPITSYIGTLGDKCYIITPVKGNSTNELAYNFVSCLRDTIVKGKMQIKKAGLMKLSGALKQKGTVIDVDNDAPLQNCSIIPQVKMLEKEGYMVLEIESNQKFPDAKDYFYQKFEQEEFQPKVLKAKGMKHKIEKIDSKELRIFLSN